MGSGNCKYVPFAKHDGCPTPDTVQLRIKVDAEKAAIAKASYDSAYNSYITAHPLPETRTHSSSTSGGATKVDARQIILVNADAAGSAARSADLNVYNAEHSQDVEILNNEDHARMSQNLYDILIGIGIAIIIIVLIIIIIVLVRLFLKKRGSRSANYANYANYSNYAKYATNANYY